MADDNAIVNAINDLTRVTLALHGDFSSKSDAIRRLAELSIPPARIAAILAVQANDVRSVLAKARKIERRDSVGATAANASNEDEPSAK
jgi:hypothetical protein